MIEKKEKSVQTRSKKTVQSLEFKDLKTDFERGSYYCTNKDYKEAFKWFKKVAVQGDAPAQYKLGVMYDTGQEVAENHLEAFKWFKKAAVQGDAPAQYKLGMMYNTGQSPVEMPIARQILQEMTYNTAQEKNHQEAFKWFKKAAVQGYAPAQHNLGVMYSEGHGVATNYKEALKWYKKAAGQGQATAQYHLGVMYNTGQGVAKNDQEKP